MKNLLRTGWAKTAILLAFVVGLVSPSALAYQVGPLSPASNGGYEVTPLTPAPNEDSTSNEDNTSNGGYQVGPVSSAFVAQIDPRVLDFNVSPTNNGANLSFSLNVDAKTTVWLKDLNNTTFKTLVYDTNLSSGQTHTYTWNGTNESNQDMPNGTYTAQVVVYTPAGTDIATQSFNFTRGTQQQDAPQVSVSVNPTSFDPSNGENVTVNYTLNTSANLKVEVRSSTNALVRTLKAEELTAAGSYNLTWNGRDLNNNVVPNNTYTLRVTATNSAGTATNSASVIVTRNGGGSNEELPRVTGLNVSPNPFNPNIEDTRVSFNLERSGNVTVTILRDGSVVRTLTSETNLSAGSHFFNWNGRNSSGNIVNNGDYEVRVTATNSAGTFTAYSNVRVNNDGNNGGSCNLVTTHYVNPSTFNPEDRNTTITFNLNRSANVSVRIKDVNSTVRTLINDSNYTSGTHQINWNGRNSSGNYVSDKSYTYEIRAYVSGCTEKVETGTVRVDRDGNGDGDYEDDWDSTNEDLIRDLYVENEVFNPNRGQRSTVKFELTRRADLKVQVLDGNRVIRTLRDVERQASGNYTYTWDGRNSSGNVVRDKVYQFRVMADDGFDTDTDRAYVEVDTDGIIIGFPENNRCAGFRDVSINSPFCKAIELMSKRRIFEGYSDGTFRPYERINRAETTKVVTLALNYNVNTSGNYGRLFPDTPSREWYAPYLRTALDNNIIHGYPDGYFRPSNTINRVELLKIFLEANDVSFRNSCAQPFEDTPINRDTNWYMKYACFAKDNDLMNAEYSKFLYPAEAMTRGDVADLFYDFDQMGYYDSYNRRNNNNNNYRNDNYVYENDRYNNDRYNEDGYYVYRNGRYEWVAY